MKKILSILILGIILVLPFTVLANEPATPDGVAILVGVLDNIIDAIWKIFVALIVIVFLYAGFLFLIAGGNPEKIGKAKSAALWGIVGVIVGILSFVISKIIIDVLDLP